METSDGASAVNMDISMVAGHEEEEEKRCCCSSKAVPRKSPHPYDDGPLLLWLVKGRTVKSVSLKSKSKLIVLGACWVSQSCRWFLVLVWVVVLCSSNVLCLFDGVGSRCENGLYISSSCADGRCLVIFHVRVRERSNNGCCTWRFQEPLGSRYPRHEGKQMVLKRWCLLPQNLSSPNSILFHLQSNLKRTKVERCIFRKIGWLTKKNRSFQPPHRCEPSRDESSIDSSLCPPSVRPALKGQRGPLLGDHKTLNGTKSTATPQQQYSNKNDQRKIPSIGKRRPQEMMFL